MADLKDKIIGGFRILAEIRGASGSQGQIFKAVCEKPPFAGIEPGTVVALKAMAVHDEDGRAWTKLEKRTSELVRLSHPNVVKYYGCFSEAGTFNDIHAIVQEYLDGETLKQRLARHPSGLDADDALRVTSAALAGLEYTAANGIVHRDVKPGNIFLCTDGSVKLIDFEIAHQEGGTTTSASGNLVGSFDYMAPDFTNSTFRGDERSDVFSMGVVMHETITGRTPYQRIEGGSGQANFAFLTRWARLHVDGTNPIRISSRANRLLAHSDEVLEKALAPMPENRYESFAAFREGLKSIRYRDLRNGDKVYRILQIIGKGGFGEVFKARLKGTKLFVAIKHLLKAAYAERFYREARIMAKLHDPCFVQFIDFFEIRHAGNREAFLVMDFLPGMPGNSLRDAIKRANGAPLPVREALLAFARYAHGLSMIHAKGIFHRDIKPSNLYYPEGMPDRAAIMDLGIARDIHGSVTSGQVPGTLDYMPPEVVLSDNRGEAGMDIYALGLCLYEALSGVTAYPRLPQGTAAYAAFFARAKLKAMPDLSAPAVVANAPLHDLLVQMTHPELSERIVDTKAVERRLAELAAATGGGVELPPDSSKEDVDKDEPAEATRTIASFEDGEQDAPDAVDPGTHGTVATIGTLLTGATSISLRNESMRIRDAQSKRESRKRFLYGLAVVGAVVVAACGAAWTFRGRLIGWLQASAASEARNAAKGVVSVYDRQGLESGRRAAAEWYSRWTPGKGGRWVDLDDASFAGCTNSIHEAELKLQDVAAENAVVEVESTFKVKGVKAGDERFESWQTEWKPKCSSVKFDELKKRIQEARESRVGDDKQKFRNAGLQLEMLYQNKDKSLEECDRSFEKWKSLRPKDFSTDEFKKLEEKISEKRAERIRDDSKLAAESALEDVVKSYLVGTVVGDNKAEAWRKNWKDKLDQEAYNDMDDRIDSVRLERMKVEREQLIKEQKKKCADELKPIMAGYRDDSSNKADTDAKYGEWGKKWKPDRDLDAKWLADLVIEVEKEKKARETRIGLAQETVRKKADGALQGIIQAYAGRTKEIAAVDKMADGWRKKWKGELDADAFSQMSAQIDSERSKRMNFEKWKEEQRVLAATTNNVESARMKLLKDYESATDKNKAAIDSRFYEWVRKWQNDEVLRKAEPNWFDKRKRTLEDAKSACETRIAEAKRARLVAKKTNEVVSVRTQLENGYKNDKSDRAELDRKFKEWTRKWSDDKDLGLGWFAEQRSFIEKERSARAVRDERRRQEQKAGREAESVCETYRSDGLAVGDGSRKMWINAWTNTLESAVFQKLSQKIDETRAKVATDPDPEGILVVKTNEVASVCAKLVGDYGDDAVRKYEIDSRFDQWIKDYENDEVLRKTLPDWFDGQRKTVETARSARENRIKGRMTQIEKKRKDLEVGYRDDSSDKAKLDGAFKDFEQKWKNNVDLTSDWLAEQVGAVEKEKSAREKRDEDRKRARRAREQANQVCDFYRKSGRDAGDVSRTMWINTWTNTLSEAVFNDLSRQIDKARAGAVVPEPPKPKPDPGPARIKKKQEQASNGADDLVSAYGNMAITRAETDRSFATWRDKWGADADLSADWLAEQRKKVEGAQAKRIARDVAEKNRKDAWDDVVRVRNGYASGVEAGDSERQIWEGKWKPVLDEATYKSISAIIEEDHKKAVDKAEEERKIAEAKRRKAERERFEKDIRAALSVDRDHVERWKGQLADAEQKIAKGKSSGVLDAQGADALQGEVNLRKKWVIGVVANQTAQAIEFSDQRIAPGKRGYFEFKDGIPAGGLSVTCAGYKPLAIGKDVLDGTVVQIGSGKWKLEPIPKAFVQIPQLGDGVTCYLDGVVRSSGDKVEVDSGKKYEYEYRRKNHKGQKGTFSVRSGELQKLSPPKEWELDSKFIGSFKTKLDDAEDALQSGYGLLCLESYHEIYVAGYRLNQKDLENVEKAWEKCDKDLKVAKEKAIKDGRYKLEGALRTWKKARRLYNELTGKE